MKHASTAGAIYQAKLPTQFALLGIRAEDGLLEQIVFLPKTGRALAPRNRLAEQTCGQIERYIVDPEFEFDLPLASRGTRFQRRVWEKISAIEPGRTRSYGELARELGSAPRAVGQACGANPLPLVVPCHRVLAASGIGGFAHHQGGFLLTVKRWLLAHEGAAAAR
jgi:methylated-DNA-[protein]-cysteine S-methyltransferase